jgi:acetyl-CoA carboxylase biotin carboxylase subunit
MFKKILVANRGEIAVRIIRACRELGITAVAVYSEADRGALHVRMADEAYAVGPAPSSESYLVVEKIIDAAKRSNADAIHPGYGFLSENASFAKACEESAITFIGPSAASIALMGSKIEARRAVARYGVESVPGTLDPVRSDDEGRSIAAAVGYPIMLKASGGGGGKGLRLVASEHDLESALRNTRSEALAAFGEDAVYIEKFVEKPRHVEIQVLADRHGNAVYLGERECTIQRRHQKVIEECPSPVVNAELRAQMGEAALKVVRAASYYNAGTVEFLVNEHHQFYFLEMNTRLQVEHAVTEMVTGLDLVKLQIAIAAGEKLPLSQQDVVMRGAAIECRIYAEDPYNNFFPSPGKITRLRSASGPGVRDDSGVFEGWTVPIEYDPLISKLVAWGSTREESIARMSRALSEYRIEGIKSNIGMFLEVLSHPDFQKGHFDTGFLNQFMAQNGSNGGQPRLQNQDRDLAVIAAVLFHSQRAVVGPEPDSAPESPWKLDGRRRGLRPA